MNNIKESLKLMKMKMNNIIYKDEEDQLLFELKFNKSSIGNR